MKKSFSVVALVSLFAAGSAMASGYRIPEQSINSTAKSGANVASASGADASYYNPAGMAFLDDAWQVEGTATYLHLTSIDYDDDRTPLFSGESEEENFLLPTLFLVSPDFHNFRFGFSITEPYGLQKRWTEMYPRAFAEKFSLKVFEFNPTVSYKFSDMFSVAGGLRILSSEATLMNNGSALYGATGLGSPAALWMNDETTEFGYNLAADLKVNDSWNLALTYRSNVDLDFDSGDVRLYPFGNTSFAIPTSGKTSVPAPAVLALSAAYTMQDWTFDLTVDRTFWSEYEDLNLDFAIDAIDKTFVKDWDDTTCVRLGVEYRLDPRFTLMGGIAYDENPIPEEHVGFDLPDSDAWLFSLGVRFKQNEHLEYGAAVLYDYKESRDVTNDNIDGEFSNASAFLVSFGVSYKF